MIGNLTPNNTSLTSAINQKKVITPLLIVALFLSLTEVVLGAAVTQTQGGVQIALTVFVITFPVLIAIFFFLVLWHKPYVFYPPTEFGQQTKVSEYVEAMQRKPILLDQSLERQNTQAPTEKEKKATDEIVDLFFEQLPPAGLLVLYACSIAYKKNATFNLKLILEGDSAINFFYSYGFLIATRTVGLINIKISQHWIVTVISIGS